MINKDDVMLIDVQYVRKDKENDLPDYLYIIYKIISTGEKKLISIPSPSVNIYFEKPEYRNHDYIKNYQWKDKLYAKTVKNTEIISAIAEDMGSQGKRILENIYQTRNYKALTEFLKYPYVFGADMDICTLYRHKWLLEYDNDTDKILTKGFMDIEVDTLESLGMPNPAENPIDLVTFIDGTTKISYTFGLVGVEYDKSKSHNNMYDEEIKKDMYASRIKQQKKLMNDIEGLKKQLHELFDESYGSFEYKFYFYHDERQMLVHLFQLINKLKLDMVGIWNISFDMPYIMQRMIALGLDPVKYICPDDFPNKKLRFKKDKIHFAVKNKTDFLHITSYTVFIDQMILYAAVRKGTSELRSTKLTYIAQKEIGDEKLNYEEDGNIKTLSYNNYRKYVIYNIKDVLLQYGIESKVNDYDVYWLSSYVNITPYESVFKQTVTLRNVQYKSYFSQGCIVGQNKNSGYFPEKEHKDVDDDSYDSDEGASDDDGKYEGALVGNPLLNSHNGMTLFNSPSNNIFGKSIDMDMSAFYPNVIIVFNINECTLIFKVILDSSIYDSRGGEIPYHGITDVQVVPDNKDSFDGDVSKEIFDNFQTGNRLSTATKWLNAPTIEDVYRKILKNRKGK